MKGASMSTKRELLEHFRVKYKKAKTRLEKRKIIDALICSTGYKRKYAINLLNKELTIKGTQTKNRSSKILKYNDGVKLALITIWNAANRICSKRLKPFIPQFIESLEYHGHLVLTSEIRNKLLTISTGTIDYLLKEERIKAKKSINTTKSGSILKKQIKVRTFADWDDVAPGFFEADLVAHCGGSVEGSFLNTLTLTDIATGWTECLPIICRSKENVIGALKIAISLLEFPILGLDTDNGSEFINFALIKFCEDNEIRFTRSRAYKKNDQAHVEEKNGSIVRKIVGYDRFEGFEACQALTELYSYVRLYVNFFQPSLKLISKARDGQKVTKKYDEAKTPCERLLTNINIRENTKQLLMKSRLQLDPLRLLQMIQEKQQNLWQYAWKEDGKNKLISPLINEQHLPDKSHDNSHIPRENKCNTIISLDSYRSTNKSIRQKNSRNYKTRKDPFENAKDKINLILNLHPGQTAAYILDILIKEEPNKYNRSQLRTLQRRIAEWREEKWYKDHLAIIRDAQSISLQSTISVDS